MRSVKSQLLDVSHSPVWIQAVQGTKFQGGGILPSEAFAIGLLCEGQGCTDILESGRHLAYSTEVFLAAYTVRVYSFDTMPIEKADARLLERFDNHAGFATCTGDGLIELPPLVKNIAGLCNRRPCVFLDGPKGAVALRLADKLLPHVAFVAIHDMSNRSYGQNGSQPNGGRVEAEKGGAGTFFTDDPDWTAKWACIDEPAWKIDYTSREEMTAYGFTLAIIPGGLWR